MKPRGRCARAGATKQRPSPQPTPPPPPPQTVGDHGRCFAVDTTRVTEAEDRWPPKKRKPGRCLATSHRPAAVATAASSSNPAWRRSARWGQPTGMLAQDTAPTTPAHRRCGGSQRYHSAKAAGPSMDVDGHQIYYDLRNELRLREWQASGMTEIYFPCPAARTDGVRAGDRRPPRLRQLPPDATGRPRPDNIGDARNVVNVMSVTAAAN